MTLGEATAWASDPRRRGLWVAVALYAFFAGWYWFVVDDAYISFRFGRSLVEGHGLVFNPGEPAVEGYSDFLWVLIGAAVQAVGLDPRHAMPAISAGCGAVLVGWVHAALGRLDVREPWATLATITFAACPAIGCWATGGLETMPFCLLVFATFDRAILAKHDGWRGVAVAGVLLALIRTEGIGWVVVIAGLAVVARRWHPDGRRPLAPVGRWLGAVSAAYAVYFAWRFATYHTLVANTAAAKVHVTGEHLVRGLTYVAAFEVALVVPLLWFAGTPVALRRWRGVGAATALLAGGFAVYGVVVGGDYMPMGRLIVAGVAPAVLLWGLFLDRLGERVRGLALAVALGVAIAGVLPSFDVHLVPESTRSQLKFRDGDNVFHSERGKWAVMKENAFRFSLVGIALSEMEKPGDAITAWAIGALGWHTHLTIFDLHGLVSAEVTWDPASELDDGANPGHDLKVGSEFFQAREPTFLRAKLVSGPSAVRQLDAYLAGWRFDGTLEAPYVEDFRRVHVAGDDTLYLVAIVRRPSPPETPMSARLDFRKRYAALVSELSR